MMEDIPLNNEKSLILLSQEPEAARAAELATRSLLYEASISPKPGLVDRFDNGAHTDMDFFTYLNSSAALTEYFRSAFLLGRDHNKESPSAMFLRLRELGKQAEVKMYAVTGGVNTHKGIIFTLGVLCGGLGWLDGNTPATDAGQLLEFCGRMVAPTLTQELAEVEEGASKTGGERFFAATGHGGIRSEAAEGYPSIRDVGLPVLCEALKRGYSMNDAGVLMLLELLCCVQDSNIFTRCGAGKQRELIENVREILSCEPLDLRKIEQLNQRCIRENISPGGCADILAATFFLYFYFESDTQSDSNRIKESTWNCLK